MKDMNEETINNILKLALIHREIIESYSYFTECESERKSVDFSTLSDYLNIEKELMDLLFGKGFNICIVYYSSPNRQTMRLGAAQIYNHHKKNINDNEYAEGTINYIIENRQKEYFLKLLQKKIDNCDDKEVRYRLIEEKNKQLQNNMQLEDTIINKSNFWSVAYSKLSTPENKQLKEDCLMKMLRKSFDEIFGYSNLTFKDSNVELSILKIKFKSVLLLFDRNNIIEFKKRYLDQLGINHSYYGNAINFIDESIDENIRCKESVFNLRLVNSRN